MKRLWVCWQVVLLVLFCLPDQTVRKEQRRWKGTQYRARRTISQFLSWGSMTTLANETMGHEAEVIATAPVSKSTSRARAAQSSRHKTAPCTRASMAV